MVLNYGKFFVATVQKPQNTLRYTYIAWLGMYILIAEHWLETEEIKFTNGDYNCEPWSPSSDWELAAVSYTHLTLPTKA